MDGHDFEFEEIHIPESVSLLLQSLDLVVGALQGARGNRMVVVGEQSTLVDCERLGEVLEHGDPRGSGPGHPGEEKDLG